MTSRPRTLLSTCCTMITHLRLRVLRGLQASPRIRCKNAKTLDTRRVPRVQSLQFSLSIDRTAGTQLFVNSMRDALSECFYVDDPTGIVAMNSPVWVSPFTMLTKTTIHANREDVHDLYRLVDEIICTCRRGRRRKRVDHLHSRFCSRTSPIALIVGRAEPLWRPCIDIPTGMLFSTFLPAFRVVMACSVETG